MIYLFAGEDTDKRNKTYEKLIKSLPDATEVFFISSDTLNKEEVENLYSSSGLFFEKSAVVFSGILEKEGDRTFILEKLPNMGESQNDFFFVEGKLTKPVLDAFKKARAELNIFELLQKSVKKEKFNTFILANALGNRDKLNLWIYFRQAIQAEVALEEMAGILFWKAKDMILKKNFSKFKEDELKHIVSHLSYLLPEARSSGKDAEAYFERFLLERV